MVGTVLVKFDSLQFLKRRVHGQHVGEVFRTLRSKIVARDTAKRKLASFVD